MPPLGNKHPLLGGLQGKLDEDFNQLRVKNLEDASTLFDGDNNFKGILRYILA